MSPCPCFHVHVSMSPCPCLHVHVSMYPCPCLQVSMSPFLHVSMYHVYITMFLCLNLNVSISQCLHFSMSPFLNVSISQCLHFSMSPCLHVSMSPCPCLLFSKFRERKTELTKNGNFRLFAANGKWKGQTSVSLLQTEMEVCFPWWANDKR